MVFRGEYRLSRLSLVGILITLLLANAFFYTQELLPRVLTVSFLDVGDGEAVLVRSPSGGTFLIDTGPDASVLRELGRTLPYWHRHIDAVVLTDTRGGVVGGLDAVQERYRVGALVTPENLKRGVSLNLGGGARLEVLYPDEHEERPTALVIRIVYGTTSFAFEGDLAAGARSWLIANADLRADVFSVPHEGKSGSVNEEWLRAISPTVAVISVGEHNQYGYPATSTRAVLARTDVRTIRVGGRGAVIFVSDGKVVGEK